MHFDATTSKVSSQRSFRCLLPLKPVPIVLEHDLKLFQVAIGLTIGQVSICETERPVLSRRLSVESDLNKILTPYAKLPSRTGECLRVKRLTTDLNRVRVDEKSICGIRRWVGGSCRALTAIQQTDSHVVHERFQCCMDIKI